MGITKIFLIILKIGMSVITARFLGPAGRGIFYSFFQASGMTNTIFTISIGEGLIYNIGRGKIKREDTFGTVISFLVVIIMRHGMKIVGTYKTRSETYTYSPVI